MVTEPLEPLTLPMHFSEIPNGESCTYQIFLGNQVEQLDKLSNWLDTLVEYLNISSQMAFRIDLILSEAVTNIIENAYDNQQTHLIQVELRYFNSKAILCVEDDGVPFNPLEKPEVELSDKLEDTKIGGLGIHLIRCYSDECNYQRETYTNRLDIVVYDVRRKNKKLNN